MVFVVCCVVSLQVAEPVEIQQGLYAFCAIRALVMSTFKFVYNFSNYVIINLLCSETGSGWAALAADKSSKILCMFFH